MSTEILTISEINQNAETILIEKLGIANTIRFLSQFNHGIGNYTAERHKWLDMLSLDDIIHDIEENRNS